MLLRTRILRDLMAGQSTASSMAQRFNSHEVAVERDCRQLIAESLITSHPVADAFIVFRLTEQGRDLATNLKR